ncbi:hypothetical protein K435DRAFT_834501 [Dendrothele bispora CBS 962.96]|uniref:Uncharacterized protein n=1 Tax=Dendrothele bispora (strain CBS 962.96) TaxID=1314807 RepID=A0A4V4HIC6_DENBC|nr:hypothetical protein K435DRAFT_834501 [Dendrothele bispora CBS 962.96]
MNTHDSLIASARQTLDQPAPPTLREILTAYRTKGDGDRDMLLAMLNAKAAEDQRIAQSASLHRALLEEHYSQASILPPITHYPSPSESNNGPLRKRHRSSRSPYARPDRDTDRDSNLGLPPSPYSSRSSRSPEFSPPIQHRPSMAIGSLVSASNHVYAASSPAQSVSDQTHHDSSAQDRQRSPS